MQPRAVKHPRVLSIAGSDPSGGAGVQADIKAISAQGGYAMAALTALTAQNTRGVGSVHVPPAAFLAEQLDAVSADIVIDAVKIGMLGTAEVMGVVGDWLARTRPPWWSLIPSWWPPAAMRSWHRQRARPCWVCSNKRTWSPPTSPNWPFSWVSPRPGPLRRLWTRAGSWLRPTVSRPGQGRALAGGGLPDALVEKDGTVTEFSAPRVATTNTHGTGCSLSAAVATLAAQTGDWAASVRHAKAWLSRALETAGELAVGEGAGPVNHFHALWESAAPSLDAFSRQVWRECEEQREAIFTLDFIKELAAGTLHSDHFAYYLAQDALYLGTYSRVLARASALAPTEAEQKFWAGGAQNCLDVELALHRDWLSKYPADSRQGPVTKHYVDHLQGVAFSGSYGEVVAAVLPCYWLYAEVGRVLHQDYLSFGGEHPYGTWLQTYADEAFAQATETAVAIMDTAARRGSAREREGMRAAFAHSAQYEVDFFAAPHSIFSGPARK